MLTACVCVRPCVQNEEPVIYFFWVFQSAFLYITLKYYCVTYKSAGFLQLSTGHIVDTERFEERRQERRQLPV